MEQNNLADAQSSRREKLTMTLTRQELILEPGSDCIKDTAVFFHHHCSAGQPSTDTLLYSAKPAPSDPFGIARGVYGCLL